MGTEGHADKPDGANGGQSSRVDPSHLAYAATADLSENGGGRPSTSSPIERGALTQAATFGRYVILKKIGTGGMGTIYAAYDPSLDRKVALKLVRPQLAAEPRARNRLLREAQALAKLSHPNVVTVYEAGVSDNRVYIAMEFVPGGVLTTWLTAEPRSWRDVLQRFLAAGRGLHAAHQADLVHRDFKPENVIIGDDGRVRVLDFGLATAAFADAREPSDTPSASSVSSNPHGRRLEVRMTATGAFMGTPAYMAIEQHTGRTIDARSDQFAFCASLYEGLYGRRAFTGTDVAELAQQKRDEDIAAPPNASPVPKWLHDTLLRGLRSDPGERWPSMKELLSALASDPIAKRRKTLWISALALVIAGLATLALLGWSVRGAVTPKPVCTAPENAFSGIWDERRQQQIRSTFTTEGRHYASDTFERLATHLDRFTDEWARMTVASCEATHVDNTQSEHMLDLRGRCLRHRRERLRALSDVLSSNPDRQVLDTSIDSVLALPSVSDCADSEALGLSVPLPDGEDIRRRIGDIESQLHRAEALIDTGQYQQGAPVASAALAGAEGIDYTPLHARALFVSAKLQFALGDFTAAETLLRAAIPRAAQAKDDMLSARLWAFLIDAITEQRSRSGEALALSLPAREAVERVDAPLLRADFRKVLGSAKIHHGKYLEARADLEVALAIRERELAANHPKIGRLLTAIANTYSAIGDKGIAFEHQQRGLRILEEGLGESHPSVAIILGNMANTLADMGEYERAKDFYKRSLALRERIYGAEHSRVAFVLNNLANLQRETADYEAALANYQRALAIARAAEHGQDHNISSSLGGIGDVQREQARYIEAHASYTEALEIRERLLGPEHLSLSYLLLSLGKTMLHLGDDEAAEMHYRRALTIRERAVAPDSPTLAPVYILLADLAMDREDHHQAVTFAERSFALLDRADRNPLDIAETRFLLARALWESGGSRTRALTLAREAREFMQSSNRTAELAAITRWLRDHDE